MNNIKKYFFSQDIMNPEDHELFMKVDHDKAVAAAEDILKSPKSEYSHLPPTPLDPFKNLLEGDRSKRHSMIAHTITIIILHHFRFFFCVFYVYLLLLMFCVW